MKLLPGRYFSTINRSHWKLFRWTFPSSTNELNNKWHNLLRFQSAKRDPCPLLSFIPFLLHILLSFPYLVPWSSSLSPSLCFSTIPFPLLPPLSPSLSSLHYPLPSPPSTIPFPLLPPLPPSLSPPSTPPPPTQKCVDCSASPTEALHPATFIPLSGLLQITAYAWISNWKMRWQL